MQEWLIISSLIIIGLVFDIKRQIEKPDKKYYMNVYLCLRSNDDPSNTSKQWLLSRFTSFRIIPRVGDTLVMALWDEKYPSVTGVKLHTDGICEVWCDLYVPLHEIADKVEKLNQEKKWIIEGSSDPKYHQFVNQTKLSGRKS